MRIKKESRQDQEKNQGRIKGEWKGNEKRIKREESRKNQRRIKKNEKINKEESRENQEKNERKLKENQGRMRRESRKKGQVKIKREFRKNHGKIRKFQLGLNRRESKENNQVWFKKGNQGKKQGNQGRSINKRDKWGSEKRKSRYSKLCITLNHSCYRLTRIIFSSSFGQNKNDPLLITRVIA